MKALILCRHPQTGLIESRSYDYEGPVPEKVWRRFAKEFCKLDAARYFWPCDSFDAYQQGLKHIIETAERIRSGEIVLERASPTTYLTRVGRTALLHFHEKSVLPVRRSYREVERETDGIGETGVDSFDIDNVDLEAQDPSQMFRDMFEHDDEHEFDVPEMTAQELGELLPGVPNGETRLRLARQILDAIIAKLPEETARAFLGYLAADGNFLEAARISGISKTKFYRLWPRWIRTAREIGEKSAAFRH